jgi:hypothetical protein
MMKHNKKPTLPTLQGADPKLAANQALSDGTKM